MKQELTLDTFGEIMDNFLKKHEIRMQIMLPEGSLRPEVADNTSLGPVMQFYIILNTIDTVVRELASDMNIDTDSSEWENTVDNILALVKDSILHPEEEA